jgi:hypothetical protein
MKLLKYPMANAFYTGAITVIYATVFILAAKFLNTHAIPETNNSLVVFVKNGNSLYVGLIMITIAVILDIVSASKKKLYDEYQCRILELNLIISSIVNIILLPISAYMQLFFYAYSFCLILLLMFLHWVLIICVNSIILIKSY